MELDPTLPFPPLREDLKLVEAATGKDGEPSWVIQDTVLNRFYRIGWLEFEFLLRWALPPAQICADIAAQTALQPDLEQVVGFRQFLEQHQLLRPTAAGLARLQQRQSAQSGLSWRWFLHHYLFFRIPLLRPQDFLTRLVRHLNWLFTPLMAGLVIALGLLGVMLALHQWDTFSAAVVESFSVNGLLSFALALAFAKAMHELAHALVATRLGLRVAHMGVAFVVLFPMLYTDTGESWKLRSARQRLAIASAGILCELAIAGLATLAWALSDPGAWRNAMLYLATTSWVLSLGLNASPFMRFDGYFILSDLLDFPNLHERASALARVAIRRGLWGLDEPWPEALPRTQRRLLIVFEFLTWLYRLVLFLGIAATVYFFFFKLLGIFLFGVEITWFIVMPILRELKYWWANRARIRANRRAGFWLLLGLVIVLLALPWRSQVAAVGVARSAHQLRVFVPFPALIQQIHAGGTVAAGDTLMVMQEPDLALRMQGSEAGLRGYEARLAGLIADTEGLEQQVATQQRINVQQKESQATQLEMARLTLNAPFSGQWMDVDPAWRKGQWIDAKTPIGVLIDPRHWQVDAYVRQDDLQKIATGNPVRFYPVGQTAVLAGTVISISSTRVKQLDHAMLASRFKGPIPVATERDTLVPNPAVFHVLVQLDTPPPSQWETRGQLQIQGQRRSVLAETGAHLLAALLRESGF
ncbi:putative peptide zinc metalloprotease protein [Silvimonas terrae]|uniref:Putative peptide zinc metalloprotease protein n=1 Tax=Silvimonas terrae TaxID=300266 RepID=A0A840RD20_9NEIS|nr:HlyD family efflux transporter periplasmic adaptor subunit [Silvimonas terrae]MBB5190867.1 putative peptide zinc metalloprotease protein [Silvimonas terrae]